MSRPWQSMMPSEQLKVIRHAIRLRRCCSWPGAMTILTSLCPARFPLFLHDLREFCQAVKRTPVEFKLRKKHRPRLPRLVFTQAEAYPEFLR